MFGWLLLAALSLSLADALFLLVVAGWIGALPTVGLVVLTALVGTLLVRSEGRTTLERVQRRLQNAEIPTDELADGVFILVGGVFLITPGLLTDLTGFLLVFPVSRHPLRVVLMRWLVGPYLREKIEDGSIDVRVTGTVGTRWGESGDELWSRMDDSDPETRDDYYDIGDDAYDIDIEDDEEH